ncbi:MAG: bifunctional diaminohydroxyphosphoribosylaminopyrimidine deaminase/5-amino-6-(5-phosphoribosylamino)uracil reductase RibD [Planctomycetota bacterium]
MPDKELHEKYMQRALELAVKGEGRVEPNPVVGAVVVKDNRVLGEGYHEYFGGPHAEINALNACREPTDGATLYITLEPCAHFGKTPPCVDAVIQAGIKNVVIATRDPNPITDNRGVNKLKEAGLTVVERILQSKARQINAPFFKLHREGLPYIIAKWAMSADGKIATRTGDSKWISSEASRNWLARLREKVGAVMVGIETVLKDDPQLLVKNIPDATGSSALGGFTASGSASLTARNPRRIILDTYARLPLDSQIIKTLDQAETYVAVGPSAPQEKVKQLWESHCHVLEIEEIGGRLNFIKLARKIAESGINKIMIEGGGEVLASAFETGLVDEVIIFLAPKIIGGRDAKTPVEGAGIELVKDAILLEEITAQQVDNDIVIRGRLRKT